MQKQVNWPAIVVAVLSALLSFLGSRFGVPAPIVTIPEQKATPTPPTPQKPAEVPASDPRSAIGKIVMKGGYCSGTVVNPQQADGSYTVVSASHCFKVTGEDVSFILRDGRQVKATVIAIDRTPDIAILRTAPVATPLPFVLVADRTPDVGSKVFHAGFGIDNPGNTEYGTITDRETPQGQVVYRLSVSPGDSGGGICLDAAGRLLSPVCCTTNLAAVGSVFGGSPENINRMLKNPTEFIAMPPAVMPEPPAIK